jgi:hypothetical protein
MLQGVNKTHYFSTDKRNHLTNNPHGRQRLAQTIHILSSSVIAHAKANRWFVDHN